MKKFEKVWTDGWYPDYTKFLYSGWAILDKIQPHDRILDIGCGYNLFKKHFGDRLYGIDPYNPAADELVSWEDYQPTQKFNVYFALGSLHFGDDELVESQIKKLSHSGRCYFLEAKPWHTALLCTRNRNGIQRLDF
jgi:SAM-dependent methyltransferase